MLNIIISDRRPIVRIGLRNILEREYKNTSISEVSTIQSALKILKKNKIAILISDVFLDNTLSIDWVQKIAGNYPDLPILILSSYAEEIYAVRLIKAGARGYISNLCEPKELVKAIGQLLDEKKYLTSSLAELMADHLIRNHNKQHHELLSAREFEVFIQIASGKKYTEIANTLFLSPNTISTYRSRIMEKMNFKNNYDLINYSMINKLV